MIGLVKVIEAASVSEPTKVPIAILWPQKAPPELRARSRELAEQAAQDYTPANEAASQSATSGFGPLYYLAAGLLSTFSNGTLRHSQGSNKLNNFPLRLITETLPTKRPGISILVLKETRPIKAPIDRVVVLPQAMRQAHLLRI